MPPEFDPATLDLAILLTAAGATVGATIIASLIEAAKRLSSLSVANALVLAQPALEPARPALEAFAAQDYGAFSAKYPRPAVDPRITALTSRVTPSGGATPSNVVSPGSRRHNDRADDRAQELMAKTPTLSYEDALKAASREIKNTKGAS